MIAVIMEVTVAMAGIYRVCSITTLIGKYSYYPHLQARKLRLREMDDLIPR